VFVWCAAVEINVFLWYGDAHFQARRFKRRRFPAIGGAYFIKSAVRVIYALTRADGAIERLVRVPSTSLSISRL